jgi:lipopolysaccharide/colanic/teichoic acid biosynthesis glycosyltransferase
MRKYVLLKRVVDPVIALILFISLLPVFIPISLMISLTSKGPILFKQKRVGHNGKIFTLYKFRSMVKNAEKLKEKYKHLNYADGPVFKIADDPRFTALGHFLNRTNLDEIPQLLNIIKGEMFFVGFRPPTPDEVEKYSEWHMERFRGYPGITSSWAVEGMHSIRFDDWIKMDIEFEKKRTLLYELKIASKTISQISERVFDKMGKILL